MSSNNNNNNNNNNNMENNNNFQSNSTNNDVDNHLVNIPLDTISNEMSSGTSSSTPSSNDITIPSNNITKRKRLINPSKSLIEVKSEDLSTNLARVHLLYPQDNTLGYHSFKDLSYLSLTSLGIIFGDIGTSVLYVFSSMFIKNEPTETNVIGAVSLIVWALILTVCYKYLCFILSADNNGEGGILSLQSLINSSKAPKTIKTILSCIAIIGSALTLGDGIITPSVSVLSAVEGLGVGVPSGKLDSWIMPIALIILFLLFLFQSNGTEKIGVLFGPIMLLWFVSIAAIGLNQIIKHPIVFKALNPWEGLRYIGTNKEGILILGFVILSVTGCEALFADLGHFGKNPIRISWFIIVFPSLLLNYLGQAAFYLENGSSVSNPFYEMIPKPILWPMIILATMATIIASQSLITGSFSVINQAIHLNYFPLVKVKHTSKKIIGQIYIAEVNYLLMVLTLIVVVGFKHSANLIDAYGLGVSFVMVLTTILYLFVLFYKYEAPIWKLLILGPSFILVDVAYFSACITKIPTGGWLPIVVGVVLSSIMLVWKFGRDEMINAINSRSHPLSNVLSKNIDLTSRLLSTGGIFMSHYKERTPISFMKLLPLLKSNIPFPLLFITINQLPVPFIKEDHRVLYNELIDGKGIYEVLINYGYSEVINIPKVINDLVSSGSIKTKFNTLISSPPLSQQSLQQSPPSQSSQSSPSSLQQSPPSQSLSQSLPQSPQIPSTENNLTPNSQATSNIQNNEVNQSNGSDNQSSGHKIIGINSRYSFTYFLSKERVYPSKKRNILSKLYIKIFDILLRNSRSDADYFGIHFESIMDVGSKFEI